MKTRISITVILMFLFSSTSFGQFTFGVSPGFGLNGTYFGWKVNPKIVPYVGFQYMNANFMYEETGLEFDYDINQIVPFEYTQEFKGSVFIPNIGVKYFFQAEDNLRPYADLSISKPILSGEVINDGTEDKDFKDMVEAISLWGVKLGFGAEYFFDQKFSVGGEFGFMYMNVKYNREMDDVEYNPQTNEYVPEKVTEDLKLTSSPTYSKITLNFYFN